MGMPGRAWRRRVPTQSSQGRVASWSGYAGLRAHSILYIPMVWRVVFFCGEDLEGLVQDVGSAVGIVAVLAKGCGEGVLVR